MTKAVIFDMDGLMFDTERVYADGWEYAGRQTGYDIKRDFLHSARGGSQEVGKKLFREKFGNDFDYDYVRDIRRRYADKYFTEHGVDCMPGLITLLDYLKEHHIGIALATSTYRDVAEWYMNLAGVKDYFDVKIFGDMVSKGKPDPDIYLKAVECLGLPAGECIVLEDSINGSWAGYRAGCKVIMVPDQTPPTDEIRKILYKCCKSLDQVIKYLD